MKYIFFKTSHTWIKKMSKLTSFEIVVPIVIPDLLRHFVPHRLDIFGQDLAVSHICLEEAGLNAKDLDTKRPHV